MGRFCVSQIAGFISDESAFPIRGWLGHIKWKRSLCSLLQTSKVESESG